MKGCLQPQRTVNESYHVIELPIAPPHRYVAGAGRGATGMGDSGSSALMGAVPGAGITGNTLYFMNFIGFVRLPSLECFSHATSSHSSELACNSLFLWNGVHFQLMLVLNG